MKIIQAIIRPYKLDAVKTALGNRIEDLFITEVKGFGRQRGHSEIYRGSEYKVEFVPKLRLELLCEDEDAESLIALISESVRSGKIGDGKIFLSKAGQVIRIEAEERVEALN